MFFVDRMRRIFAVLRQLFLLASTWLFNQLTLRSLIQTTITLCLFGLVPKGWLIGLPLLAAYATVRFYLYKKYNATEFKNMLNHDFSAIVNKLSNFKQTLTYKKVFRYCLQNPLSIGKFTFSFFILFLWSMPFSFFSIYGLYRFSSEKWRAVFVARAINLYHIIKITLFETNRELNLKEKIVMFFAGSAVLIAGVSALWGSTVVALGMVETTLFFLETTLEICTVTVGLTAIAIDVEHLINKPIQNFTENSGKFYGMVLGRWLAFSFFPGKVVGSMGPATGHVDQSGVLASVFGFLFPPTGSSFLFGTGLTGLITTRAITFINSIVTSIFFSYNMRIAGDFYGVIGPTSFQIFLCMATGCFFGYILERIASDIYEAVAHDVDVIHHTKPVQNSIMRLNRTADWLFRQRWNIIFSLLMAPVILTSSGGAAIYGLAYGNELLAAVMVFSAGFISMALVDNLFNEVRRTFHAFREVSRSANMVKRSSHEKQSTTQFESQLDSPSPVMLHAASRGRETPTTQTPAQRDDSIMHPRL